MALLKALIRPRTDKQVEGDAAEDRAVHYLKQQGMKLVERNFRCKGGEIDIVMHDRGTLVFVEVRKRASGRYGGAAASITASKQARLVIAAQTYLQGLREQPPCRFDVIAIEEGKLEWLKNAIEV